MAGGQLNTLVRHLLRAAGPGAAGGLSDAHLLERFVRSCDEAAFEVLVWRHGAMVLRACRRLLRRRFSGGARVGAREAGGRQEGLGQRGGEPSRTKAGRSNPDV